MSDFDDEPTAGDDQPDEVVDAQDSVPEATVEPAADDWDDEPAPAKRSSRRADANANAKAAAADDDWDDDDWDDDDDDRRGGRRDMTLVYAVIAAAVVIVLAIVLTSKDDNSATDNGGGTNTETSEPTEIVKNWQGPVGDAAGDAQARAESEPGVYIWTDFGGWHLRNNGTEEITVTVTAEQVRVKTTDDGDDEDENADDPFKTETVVTIPAGDGATGTGLDLGTSESATFTVTAGGTNVPASDIKLGGAEGVADQNPVTFTKS